MTDAASPAALSLVGVSKTYLATRALDSVSLTVLPGEVHGLVGGNGSGKSTLIMVVAGVEPADRGGELEVRGERLPARRMRPRLARRMGLRFVHQEPAVFPHLTVAENLAIGNGHSRAQGLLERFEIDASPRDRMSALPPAARAMVAVARALDVPPGRPQVLLLDEPTSPLGIREAAVVMRALRGLAEAGHAVLFASHRLEEVLSGCGRVSVLRDGRLEATVDAGRVGQDELAEMVAGSPVHRAAGPARRRSGDTLLEVRDLEGDGLAAVSFDLRSGEVLGIAGPPGPGCSSLLQSIFRSPADALAAGIAYVPADRARQAAFPHMSVCENLFQTDVHRRGVLRRRAEREGARRVIDSFRIDTPSEAVPLSILSGGNQQKVVVARWLRRRPRVLLLDDPTRSVDVGARAEIHRFIRRAVEDEGSSAIIVTSDLHELEQVADRVLIVGRGGVEAEIEGPDVRYDRLVELTDRAAVAAA